MSQIQFTRINNDVNGNPRYVCHFLNLIGTYTCGTNEAYKRAIKLANKIGGRKFHNKQYGGGIVFQSSSPEELERDILELKAANQ